ncbi:diacylglycerol/lipid kinase family protein [Crateriforma spongiae]|uniref:diacylglycerol/lipid kinase family protein n=1 Tax=Crateriforma spongiae TaxID=2724528 RepID=UPI001F328B3E|nr:diacylglycerol kinase family protein [Crateriforma spongiae]
MMSDAIATTQADTVAAADVLWIWNQSSGRGLDVSTARAAQSQWGGRWLKLSQQIDLGQVVARAVNDGLRTVVAAGGDGTVNAVVNAIMQLPSERRPVFGILPLGTANDFARTLGMPADVQQSAAVLQNARVIPGDVIRVSDGRRDRYFANVAAGGNSVRVSEQLDDQTKAFWGAFSYLRGAMDVLPDMRSYHVDARSDGHRDRLDCWAVIVANGRTNAGHIEVAPEASICDGRMDVVLIRDGEVAEMAKLVASNLLGRFLESDQVLFRQVRSLQLSSDPPMRFSIDGEIDQDVPTTFEVIPAAIRMIVGDGFVVRPPSSSLAPAT